MDTVKQWALTVAISAVAGAIVLMLAPEGSMKKSVCTAVSLFLIIALLFPFLKGIDLSDFSIISDSEYEQPDLTGEIAEQMKQAIKSKIISILNDCGVKSTAVNIDISVEGEKMLINKIEIFADSSGDITTAENRIKTEIGTDVKIEVNG